MTFEAGRKRSLPYLKINGEDLSDRVEHIELRTESSCGSARYTFAARVRGLVDLSMLDKVGSIQILFRPEMGIVSDINPQFQMEANGYTSDQYLRKGSYMTDLKFEVFEITRTRRLSNDCEMEDGGDDDGI